MGQEFSSETAGQSYGKVFTTPSWYDPNYMLTHASIAACKASINSIKNGKLEIFNRVHGFGFNLTPLDFFYRQFYYRLAVLSPMFIRVSNNQFLLNHYDGTLRANDILHSEFAKMFFNDFIINPINDLYQCTSVDTIQNHLSRIVRHLYTVYQVDAAMFSDIAFLVLNVLSDCLGKDFDSSYSCWIGLFSMELKAFIDMNVVDINTYGVYSIRETMLKLNQPYIDWSDGLLGTKFAPMDRQHQWLLTLVNILIHICSNNVLKITVKDVIDALFDYSYIHFTEEEMMFMNSPNYAAKEEHRKQHHEFLQTITDIRKEMNMSNENVLSQETLNYMIAWLTNHIRIVDKQMVESCVTLSKALYVF